jgi:hypothetical protein
MAIQNAPSANFFLDIFLPEWLAKHNNNKLIFGSLFAVGELFLLWQWSLLTASVVCTYA